MKPPQLISITRPVDPDVSPENLIVQEARVSNPDNEKNFETSEKLLTYCFMNGHYSIFEMVDMTVKIETSRAIMAQVLRHHSFRFQEWSQRYSEVDKADWSHVEMRKKGSSNRQGSLGVDNNACDYANSSCLASEKDYRDLVSTGIAPESARMVLPLATPTSAYMKGSVRSWITYFWQRCDPHTQKEHRELAEAIFVIFKEQFPIIGNMTENYKPVMTKR